MSEPFFVRGYGRASTLKQIMSPVQQESVVREAFELFKKTKPGWEQAIWGGFHFDEATSRDSKFHEREVGSLLLAMTKPGDKILVSNYDRIFANVVDVCETLEMVERVGFGIIVLDMDIPLDSSLGKAVFQILSIVKGLEVQEIRRRTRNAHAHRRKAGLPQGKPPIGWSNIAVTLKGGHVRRFYKIDRAARQLGEKVLKVRMDTGLALRPLAEELKRRQIKPPSGYTEWTAPCLTRWIKAAALNYPLRNGSHEPAPIPPDAMPVETLSPP